MNIVRPANGHPVHARFDGPIVMLGFGSIGKGTLPLIERHIAFDRARRTTATAACLTSGRSDSCTRR